MEKAISVDWLQLHVDCSEMNVCSNYEWIKQNYQTKQFRKVFKIIYKREEFATVVYDPTSPIIPPYCMLVKISNRELYGQNIVGAVSDFLTQSNLKFLNMTRIDIACDFNVFKNNLNPHNLIKRFVNSKYLKIGQGKYSLNGSQAFEHTFDYLRFGSKTSDINVYLYNKTKEFEEVKDKPYIKERWLRCGLDVKKTVWRLEISLKSSGSDYLNESTGELMKLNYMDIGTDGFLYQYYFAFINKYFRFVKDDGKSRKDRMEKVILFDQFYTPFVPCYLPDSIGASRSDKIFLKKLHLLDQELRGFNEEAIMERDKLINTFVTSTNLAEYYEKKSGSWSRDSYRS